MFSCQKHIQMVTINQIMSQPIPSTIWRMLLLRCSMDTISQMEIMYLKRATKSVTSFNQSIFGIKSFTSSVSTLNLIHKTTLGLEFVKRWRRLHVVDRRNRKEISEKRRENVSLGSGNDPRSNGKMWYRAFNTSHCFIAMVLIFCVDE